MYSFKFGIQVAETKKRPCTFGDPKFFIPACFPVSATVIRCAYSMFGSVPQIDCSSDVRGGRLVAPTSHG